MPQSPIQSMWNRGDDGNGPRERRTIARSELRSAVFEGVREELLGRTDDRTEQDQSSNWSRGRLLLLVVAVAAVAYLAHRMIGGDGDPEAVDVHGGRRFRESSSPKTHR